MVSVCWMVGIPGALAARVAGPATVPETNALARELPAAMVALVSGFRHPLSLKAVSLPPGELKVTLVGASTTCAAPAASRVSTVTAAEHPPAANDCGPVTKARAAGAA